MFLCHFLPLAPSLPPYAPRLLSLTFSPSFSPLSLFSLRSVPCSLASALLKTGVSYNPCYCSPQRHSASLSLSLPYLPLKQLHQIGLKVNRAVRLHSNAGATSPTFWIGKQAEVLIEGFCCSGVYSC